MNLGKIIEKVMTKRIPIWLILLVMVVLMFIATPVNAINERFSIGLANEYTQDYEDESISMFNFKVKI